MNDFEKYLQENKKKLQVAPPKEAVWMNIENQVLRQQNQRNVRYIQWLSAAATILLLVAVVAVFKPFQGTNQQADLLKMYGINTDNYTQQVSLKTKQLATATIPVSRKADFDRLLHQLEFLDEQYHDYIKYIETHGYQEFIGEQILDYYQTKIELLDKIQQEISKINRYEDKFQTNSPSVGLDI